MSILVRKFDTRNKSYTGKFLSRLFEQLISDARKNNHSGAKLIWWDRSEGWCNMTCDFSNDIEIPCETYIEENL